MPVMAWTMLLALVVALAVVRVCIAYAHRRGMLDQPGQRRSHTVPTARGGGLGIIVAWVLAMLLVLPGLVPWTLLAALLAGTLAVAAIGWLDDHGALPVRPRLLVQLAACAVFAAAACSHGLAWWWWPLLLLAGTWSINLHNFIDGIDGLLAQQCIFVGVGIACIAVGIGSPALLAAGGAFATSALGFWWFNRSPARIFMGDVGSGAVGFIIFALTALVWLVDFAALWAALLLSSSVATDATLTLLSRMRSGRRWYAPHREHLYQWLVRRDHGHARVGGYYLAWNLIVVAPLAVAAMAWPALAPLCCVLGYSLAVVAWVWGKRAVWRSVAHG
jgi:UDP-N-acetylmuramyl pentapeptide phosphotransferase/UDP-N-acetylglucosamine-1-phosphate transferase